jgi:hypothetical protein
MPSGLNDEVFVPVLQAPIALSCSDAQVSGVGREGIQIAMHGKG